MIDIMILNQFRQLINFITLQILKIDQISVLTTRRKPQKPFLDYKYVGSILKQVLVNLNKLQIPNVDGIYNTYAF